MYIQADSNGIKTTTQAGWKLVHDGTVYTVLAELDGKTSTGGANELFVASTKEECEAEIARLGLVEPTK